MASAGFPWEPGMPQIGKRKGSCCRRFSSFLLEYIARRDKKNLPSLSPMCSHADERPEPARQLFCRLRSLCLIAIASTASAHASTYVEGVRRCPLEVWCRRQLERASKQNATLTMTASREASRCFLIQGRPTLPIRCKQKAARS